MADTFRKDKQFYKFCAYGFLKNLRFFEAFFILFLRSGGISFLQIGVLYAVREMAVNLLEIPTGIFADSWGRKKTMLASFVSYIAAFLLFSFSASFVVLLGAMVFYAFGDACRTGTHKAMIFDYINRQGWGERKAHYYGNTRSWSQKGSALSALLAGGIVFWQGDYSTIFLYSIVPYILDFFLILSYPAYLDRGTGRKTGGKHILRESFVSLKDRAVLLRLGNVSLFAGYYKAVKDYLQPILQSAAVSLPFILAQSEKQRSAVTIAVVYFLIYLMTSWASMHAGKVHETFKDRGWILFLSLVMGAASGLAGGLLLFFGFPWLSAAVFLMIFVIENIRKPIGISYLGDSVEPGILATVLSVESQGETLWTAIFALIIGAMADAFSLPVGLGVSAGVLFLLSLLFAREKEHASV